MGSRIEIPQYDFNGIFKPITLNIVLKDKSISNQYYLHRCQNIEFKEIISNEAVEQSTTHPETIFFSNEVQESEILQPDTERAEINDKASATEEKTLYFINEEESEP